MPRTSAQPDPGEDSARHRFRHVYLLFELLAVLVLVGVLLWLARDYQPRSPLGKGLLNARLWILVLLVSAWGTAASLIPYYVGQRGTRAIFDRYSGLEGRPMERLEATFQRWGAFSLILSGIPVLVSAFLVAAGAVGIGRRTFLIWVFLGKVVRYWVLAFIVLSSLQLLG